MLFTYRLHDYADRYGPLSELKLVGTFEVETIGLGRYDGLEALLGAIQKLREENPRGLPIVTDGEGRKVDMLHVVRCNGEFDVLFQSIDLAHSWLERRYYLAKQLYYAGGPDTPDFMVTSMLVNGFPDQVPPQVQAMLPKSVWEWLREPAF